MQIKDYICKCGFKEFFVQKKSETQWGIYCAKCGKWLKWASKDEKNLIAREMVHLGESEETKV